MKRCRRCGETKPLDEFYRSPKNAGGRQTACKACSNAMNLERRARDPGRAREVEAAARRRARLRDPEKYRELSRRNQAQLRRTPQGRRSRAEKARREREALSDYYVKTILVAGTALHRSVLPPELIELKREQLRLQRLAQALRQAAKKAPE